MRFRRRLEEALQNEIQDYLDRETQLHIEAGLTAEEARAAARRKLGPPSRVMEDTRAAWGWVWLERLWQDLSQAGRSFAKNPGFNAVAVFSLAIGIGANCAMFSLADALLLRPLSVPRPGEVLALGAIQSLEGFSQLRASYPDYVDLRDHTRSFAGMVAFTCRAAGLTTKRGELPELAFGVLVSANLFDAMEVKPALGRGFLTEEDSVPGRDAVVVLDHGFWEKQFSRDPSILGKRILLNGIEFTVIGVAPPDFMGLDSYVRPAFYAPLMMLPRLSGTADILRVRAERYLTIRGRLNPGFTIAQARAEVAALGENLARTYPDTNRNQRMTVRTHLEERVVSDPPDAMLVALLMTLAIIVLLVACANVAGLLTSRAPVRAREISLRMAIGAGRGRLVRQLLTESLLIALAGGAFGLVVGYSGMLLFRQIEMPSDLPPVLVVQLDQRALVFSSIIAILSLVLFGLAPALRTTRMDLVSALKTSGTGDASRRRMWGRNTLVAGQVAVALVLLTVSASIYRTFRAMFVQGPGFRTDHLLMMSFDPQLVSYSEAQAQQFYRRLIEQARLAPGVRGAALASTVPFSNDGHEDVSIIPEGYQLPAGRESIGVFASHVGENYFEVMDIPLVSGRGFRETDTSGTPLVAVVNERFARHYWPGQDGIGKRFRLGDHSGPWVEIVGVARDAKYEWIAEPPRQFVYLPVSQHPRQRLTLLAESSGDAGEAIAPLREVVRSLDATQPIFNVFTMERFYEMRTLRIGFVLNATVASMGTMGLVLALVGLYGLVAYGVGRRTREFGIRIAIGAGGGSMLRMVLGQAMVLALIGIGSGLALSLGARQGLRAVFPTTNASELMAYALVVPAILAVTMLAAYIPARRASRVNPMIALWYE